MNPKTPKQLLEHARKCPNENNADGKKELITDIVYEMLEPELDWILNKLTEKYDSQNTKPSQDNEDYEYNRFCQKEVKE